MNAAPTICRECGETIRNPSPSKHVCDACVGLGSEGHYIKAAPSICRACGNKIDPPTGKHACSKCPTYYGIGDCDTCDASDYLYEYTVRFAGGGADLLAICKKCFDERMT